MIMVVLYDMIQVGSGVLRRLMAVGEDSRASAVAASRLHFTRPGPRASDGIGWHRLQVVKQRTGIKQ